MFYSTQMMERAKANVRKHPWAAGIQAEIVKAAQPWMKLSDDELWPLMFGHTISRSWMVWSNGHCPTCEKDVPMYDWEVDAFSYPWKVGCPRCKEFFPKNDFYTFYLSGLDEHGVFDPKRADRALLFNLEHPDPKDPLHTFGVDDGEGYVEGEKRWRFIGAYLIYGQWKQTVLGGIQSLAAAYVVTGDSAYAHKAGVLLDRVADLYPTFDSEKEGYCYEKLNGPGYVSIWHDACVETRYMALAYDQFMEALRNDEELVAFLSRKATQFNISNPKASFEDIRRNIEERIFRDAINHPKKIMANYPQTDLTLAILKTVLEWPENRDEVYALLDTILEKATAVDGVSGEKGLVGYAAWGTYGIAALLAQYARIEPDFLAEMYKRHPNLRQTFRFHIDTWYLQKYYPLVGDGGDFAQQVHCYMGVFLGGDEINFVKNSALSPSMYSFLWQLYELTGDAAFVQAMYGTNGGSVEGLPHDLFAEDPEALQQAVQEVIVRKGAVPKVGSVDKQQWHLAILRSGQGADERALWMHYESGVAHAHADAMNVGLFAKGLDLMPDLGYPPVDFGGWNTPERNWYAMSAAHNTVAVDGPFHSCTCRFTGGGGAGKTTLWADGGRFRAIRVSGPEIIGGQLATASLPLARQFERTLAMMDLSDRDFYVVDIFRVVGGKDHAKFMHSHFGQITTQGLSLHPADAYGQGTKMRSFYVDPTPQPGWSVDWKMEDRYRYLPPDSDVHLRYTDLTLHAQAFTCEGWVHLASAFKGCYESGKEIWWIPRIMVRRQAKEGPLASTFVGVIEPYEKTSNVKRISRLSLETVEGATYPEPNVAVEVQLGDGRSDLVIAADGENPLDLTPSREQHKALVQKEWGLRTDGELCIVRRSAVGKVERIALCRGTSVSVGEVVFTLKKQVEFVEVRFSDSRVSVVSGKTEDVKEIIVKGENSLI